MKVSTKKVCPYCKTAFVSDNKQKIYCTPKCSMAKGYKEHVKRKEASKTSVGYFNIDEYKDGII